MNDSRIGTWYLLGVGLAGANFALADGSTQFITDHIEYLLYVGLSTRATADAATIDAP